MDDPDGQLIEVEVVYALPETQTVTRLRVPYGTTIGQAIAASRILERHPQIDAGAMRVGIFGQRKPLAAIAVDGDRIEIYRPLIADPREARRNRARREKAR
jgi:putative ubiquitin-RnfH superfamily antitoxin RatB of RatAB toxin-antitoxin module